MKPSRSSTSSAGVSATASSTSASTAVEVGALVDGAEDLDVEQLGHQLGA